MRRDPAVVHSWLVLGDWLQAHLLHAADAVADVVYQVRVFSPTVLNLLAGVYRPVVLPVGVIILYS